MSAWQLLLLLVLVALIKRAIYVYTAVKRVKGVPRYICLVEPISPWSMLFPRSRWTPDIYHAWLHKERYEELQGEMILFVPLLLGNVALQCGSPEAGRQIYTDYKVWTKPKRALLLNIMGDNVLTHNGEAWRKHRKITSPAFDNQIYADVWRVTTSLYKQMIATQEWKSSDQHYFENFNVFTTRLALLVIAACGFNMDVPWEGSLRREGFADSLDSIIIKTTLVLLPRMMLPRWIFKLPVPALRNIDQCFSELQRFLDVEIAAKKQELALEKSSEKGASANNLFSRVVLASQVEGSAGLTHDEIRGNLWIYLFAGHETTAHVLVTTLAFLAVNQQEQERVHDHIVTEIGDRDMAYEDYGRLSPVLHCFYETLRLFPSATHSLRETSEDVVLTAPGLTKDSDTVFVGEGIQVFIDTIGACRNARNFPNPTSFNPRRWESSEASAMDNFIAFSFGPRMCLGRKFSTVEAVCFLSNLLRDWKFDVKLESGETLDQWQERVMQPELTVTVKINEIPLLVSRRAPVGTL